MFTPSLRWVTWVASVPVGAEPSGRGSDCERDKSCRSQFAGGVLADQRFLRDLLGAGMQLCLQLLDAFLQPLAAVLLVGGDDRLGEVVRDDAGDDPGKEAADKVGQEDLVPEVVKVRPVGRVVGEHCKEIVPEIRARADKLAEDRR